MSANASSGIQLSVGPFLLKTVAVAVGLIVFGYLIAQTQANTDFNGVVVGILYSTGGLMLLVIGVGFVGDLITQLRRRRRG